MAHRKRPWLAVALSLLWPGLGHFYLEEDGLGAYLFLLAYFCFLIGLPGLLLILFGSLPPVPWVVISGVAILAIAATDAYRLALRYNRFGGPSAGPRKHIDYVDSADARVTRTTLRLR